MEPLFHRVIASPVGTLTLIASERGARAIHFGAISGFDDEGRTEMMARQLDEYFRRERTQFDLQLDVQGTPFQMKVWSALCRIPYGTTASYAAIAGEVGQPKAVRAVGGANRRNPLPIVIPCHRVIGADGSLTGYAGQSGLAIKAALLELEHENILKTA